LIPVISALTFDSSLFGYPVGKCLAASSWEERDFLKAAKPFKLVYLVAQEELSYQHPQIFPADIRLTFSKNLDQLTHSNEDVQSFDGDLTDSLLELALESGVYSRFKKDPRFVDGEFEKLYTRWIKKALDQKEVLISRDHSAFVTCQVVGEEAQIGLIAVAKSQRGKGWGKKLIHEAEQHALRLGANRMVIGTQESNLPASALYQALGYQLVERSFIYHFWH
jgi:dTDP-4-amino-4,6-dideoxy-D-galactose acyltransferase